MFYFILMINVKMPTIVDILTFMSKVKYILIELSMKKLYNLWAWLLIYICLQENMCYGYSLETSNE